MQDIIKFHRKWFEATKDFPDDARLEIFDAILQYALDGTVKDLTPLSKMVFPLIKQEIDNDKKRIAEISAKRRDAGKQGGAPKNNRNAIRNKEQEQPEEPIDTNNNRMARQRQYMMNFIQKALQMTKEDIMTPVKLFNIAMEGDYMVTNLTMQKVTYLTTIFSKVNFTEESFKTIPGQVVAGEEYAEFHVDDEVLYQMILDTFYLKQ